jgi:hypothetical protein
MTRDEFFLDVAEALRLVAQLGPDSLKAEVSEKIAASKTARVAVTPDDLRRYSETIDWAGQGDARLLADLARVLLRIVAGLGAELESFRQAGG